MSKFKALKGKKEKQKNQQNKKQTKDKLILCMTIVPIYLH